MKDYTLDKESKKTYITKVKQGKVEDSKKPCLTIELADKAPITYIEDTEENLRKIEIQQEKQAKDGIENYPTFKLKRKKSALIAATTAVAVAGTAAYTMANAQIASDNPTAVLAGFGILALASIIPSVHRYTVNKGKTDELEKIIYRNDHQEELDSLNNYQNSLNGIAKGKAAMFATEENPFSILHIDDYSKDNLERIVNNIEKEKSFGFTYVKKTNKAK